MNFRKRFLKFVLAAVDIVIMYSSLLYVLSKRVLNFSFLPGSEVITYLVYFSFIHLIWLIYLFLLDFYEIPPLKDVYEFFSNLAIFLLLALSTASIIFYFQIKVMVTPKTVLLMDIIGVGVLIFLWRLLFSWFLRIINFSEKILIIGSKLEFEELTPEILRKNSYDIMFYKPAERLNIPFLKAKTAESEFDSIVLAFDLYKEKNLVKEIFSNLSVGLNYVEFTSFYENLLKKVPIDSIDEIWFLENLRRKGRFYDFFKRIFDIFFATLCLIITAVFFVPIALLIKIGSRGAIFYKQTRVGKDGKDFVIYKFRTMSVEPEEKNPHIAFKNENRIIPVGRFLRLTHLDELPQFYNILKGDISFVGPRPEWREFVNVYKREVPFYDIRSLIKPGLTGWAQIKYHNGATVEEIKEKLKYDLYYVKHHSLPLDLAIILKTVTYILKSDIQKIFRRYRKVLPSYHKEISVMDIQPQLLKKEITDILVLDDEEAVQDLLVRFFRKDYYNVVCASSAEEAIGIVKNNRVKLAIVDIKLPGQEDGLGVLEQIKRMDKDINVILITGYGTEKTRRLSYSLGAYGYFEKPLDLSDIKNNVEAALSKQNVGG